MSASVGLSAASAPGSAEWASGFFQVCQSAFYHLYDDERNGSNHETAPVHFLHRCVGMVVARVLSRPDALSSRPVFGAIRQNQDGGRG
jgi:hypothetical protein